MERLLPEDPEFIGPWELVSRLGTGGMGEVFIGKQGTNLAAVKVIHPWLTKDPSFKSRFAREIDSLRELKSPYVAQLFDYDVSATYPWLAMEYVDGPSLKQEVETNGPLNDVAWSKLAHDALAALQDMLESGIVHRDIKPSNLILSSNGLKVIDFGLAQQSDATSLTMTGLTAGSPAWLSPEQVNGEEVTGASDLFSLGTVLAYAKSGVSPWGNGPTAVTFHNIVLGKVDLSHLTEAQRNLVSTLLSPDPQQRFTAQWDATSTSDVEILEEVSVPENVKQVQELSTLQPSQANFALPPSSDTPTVDRASATAPDELVSDGPTTHSQPSRKRIIIASILSMALIATLGVYLSNKNTPGSTAASDQTYSFTTSNTLFYSATTSSGISDGIHFDGMTNTTKDAWEDSVCVDKNDVNAPDGLSKWYLEEADGSTYRRVTSGVKIYFAGEDFCAAQSVTPLIFSHNLGQDELARLAETATPKKYRFWFGDKRYGWYIIKLTVTRAD